MNENYINLVKKSYQDNYKMSSGLDDFLKKFGFFDVSPRQFLLLEEIGKEEVFITQITTSRMYYGTNPSYNIRKLINNGYLVKNEAEHDKRISYLKSTKKGIDLVEKIKKEIIKKGKKDD